MDSEINPMEHEALSHLSQRPTVVPPLVVPIPPSIAACSPPPEESRGRQILFKTRPSRHGRGRVGTGSRDRSLNQLFCATTDRFGSCVTSSAGPNGDA